MTIFRFNCLLAMVLMGCDQADPRICTTPPPLPTKAAATPEEQVEVMKGCVHRWAYRLSGAKGSNEEIASATAEACSDAIERATQLTIEREPAGVRHLVQAKFGEIRTLYRNTAVEQALFRVVQARAGKCEMK